jgi:hypothetical protein
MRASSTRECVYRRKIRNHHPLQEKELVIYSLDRVVDAKEVKLEKVYL